MLPDSDVASPTGNSTGSAAEPRRTIATPSRARRLETTFSFLRELWLDGLPEGAALVVSNKGFTSNTRLRCLLAVALAIALNTACYFNCALMPEAGAGRGEATQARGIPGVWFDLDCREGKHRERNLPTFTQAYAFLRTLPCGPTLVLHSGGGLYVWWLFREPWFFDTDAERERAARLVAQWQGFVRERAAQHGWNLDDTSPLTQALRPEGAISHKYDPPALVHRIITGGPRWNPCELEEWFASESDTRGSKGSCRGSTELPKDLPPSIAKAIQGLGRPAIEKRKQTGQLNAVVLDLCPVCKGIQATERGTARFVAHVAPLSGALRCKRQTCEAHGDGIAFKDWVPRFLPADLAREVLDLRAQELQALHPEAPIPALHADGVDEVDLAQADGGRLEQCLGDAIKAAQSKRKIALVVVPTGVGKTRAVLAQLSRQPSAYFARTHELLAQIAAELKARGVPHVHILGVGKACWYGEAYEHYGSRPDWRGSACQSCAHRVNGTCGAWKQIPLDAVILAPHESLAVLRKMRQRDPTTGKMRSVLDGRLVVIDEAVKAVEEIQVDREQLHTPLENAGVFGQLSGVAERVTSNVELLLARALRERREKHEDEYPTRFHGEALRTLWVDATRGWNLAELQATIQSAAAMSADVWPKPNGSDLRESKVDRALAPHPSLRDVWAALAGIAGDSEQGRARAVRQYGVLEVVATDKDVHIEVRRRVRIPMGKHTGVVMLDATGLLTRAELQAANPRTPIEVFGLKVKPDPAARVLRVFIKTTNVTRRQLLDRGHLTPRGVGTIRSALRQVAGLAQAHIGTAPCTCSLITFKVIELALGGDPELLGAVTPKGLLLTPARIGHYWCDERGSNRFKGMQVHVTFGDPRQNLGSLDADARALRTDLRKLDSSRIAATLVQAHGRNRALRATGPVLLVHVGTVVPADWEKPTTVGLKNGRPPASARKRVVHLVERLLASGQVVAVPIVRGMLTGRLRLPDPLAKTAISDSLDGTFGQTPPPPTRSLTRWVAAAAKGRSVSIGIVVGDAKWRVWRPELMAEAEARAQVELAYQALRTAAPGAAVAGGTAAAAAKPRQGATRPSEKVRPIDPLLRAVLTSARADLDVTPWRYAYDERAAILEHSAGLERGEAERRARKETLQALRVHLSACAPAAGEEADSRA